VNMFVDSKCDAILLRDVVGPQLYCRACHHLTYEIDGKRCAWCKSQSIGVQPRILGRTRPMGPITEPEDREPTKHRRLREGFAILHANEGDQ
jgi:hypothetical protein